MKRFLVFFFLCFAVFADEKSGINWRHDWNAKEIFVQAKTEATASGPARSPSTRPAPTGRSTASSASAAARGAT